MKLHCLIFLFILVFNQLKAQNPDYYDRINRLYDNIYRYFSASTPGLFIETTDTLRNEKPFSYLWPLCALIQAANEMEVLEPQREYFSPVLKSIMHYYNPDAPSPGYQAYVTSAGKDTRYIDDNQWIGIACMDAYKRTKKIEYLEKSKEIYRFMMTGYDTISGGGLYWREGDKSTKNTCSNGPGIILALQLYIATGDKKYFDTALGLFNWVNKYLRSPEGIYYDALKVKVMRIDSAKYTYNTGTMLQSHVMFFNLTGNKSYLDEAHRIASAAKDFFYRNNQLPDHYWFNSVLMRGFTELSKVDGNTDQIRFFSDEAERIWNTQKDEKGLVGRRSARTLIDQAAILEMFARLQQLDIKKAKAGWSELNAFR